jgi:hypothetical protein
VKHLLGALALACIATTARAQVAGHLPENSPYSDLETSQEFTFFGGRYTAGKDPIGIAPRDGPMYGLRYQIHVGGPAFLMARWSHVNSSRFAIDPTKTGTARQLGKQNVSVDLFDVDLAINLICFYFWWWAQVRPGRAVSADIGLERLPLPAEVPGRVLPDSPRRDCCPHEPGSLILEEQSRPDARRLTAVLSVT